jgi:peptidyl-tRNA hydrolase, PTH1 family
VKLIVGLGNPGEDYRLTPHNMGFLAVDRLASELGIEVRNRHCRALTGRGVIGSEDLLLAKPETFMNLSGLSIRELVAKYEVDPQSDMIVIYDELDLPFGTIRIRERGGTAGHNGMESVVNAVGTQDFLRIRLGIAPDRKPPDGAEYVLTPFKKKQMEVVEQVLDTTAEAIKVILQDGRLAAMNRFNRKDEADEMKNPQSGEHE